MKDIKNRVEHLMQKLKSNNIEIVLSGKDLKISYDEESMTEELLNELKINKIEIITFLEKQSKLDSDNFIPRIDETPYGYPLTPAQRRVWILSQDDNYIYSYNVLDTIILKGELNRAALEASIYDLIERHEILRTVFDLDESGNVKQFIKSSEDLNFKVDFQDIRNGNISDQEIQRIALKEVKVVFDFIKGPMIKCLLLQIEDRKWGTGFYPTSCHMRQLVI